MKRSEQLLSQPQAAKGHIGKWQSEAELQLIHNVNRRLTLVSETNAKCDTRDPSNRDHLNHYETSKWLEPTALQFFILTGYSI